VQPKLMLADGTVCGFEALARWHHKSFGPISPLKLSQIADATDKSLALGMAVLNRALETASMLATTAHRKRMSVNVSPAFAEHPNFPAEVLAAIAKNGLTPHDLELELTETAVMADIGAIHGNLTRLQQLGVVVAIDDFGAGYSNIGRLLQFSVSVIKVDKSVIDDVVEDSRSRAVMANIVDLSRSLGTELIVEGLESQEQADILYGLGVERAQGSLFAQPMHPQMLISWLKQWKSRPLATKVFAENAGHEHHGSDISRPLSQVRKIR